ncbi:TIGR01244 family sulfur transferase [Marinospirillum sp.]|uniref:TIGR01244 family sulfur transferase n=1 Tax=Marinospirillum sp. TaxID=2183934 RepID=UPI003A87C956
MAQLPEMRQLEADLQATSQLTAEQIKALAEQGVKTLIFNRPDQEGEDQPATAELKQAAEAVGIQWFHQPVISGQVTDEQGVEFGQIYAKAPKPVVAFCRTGARCGCLWALSKKNEVAGEELVNSLKSAGYDLPDFFKRLTA